MSTGNSSPAIPGAADLAEDPGVDAPEAAGAADGAAAKLRHLPALDGYRGLAVAAVVLFHADLIQGGWLGVDVFFVLSGFLITRLVVHEQATTGGVGMWAFWRRRGRRLLPALVAFMAGVAIYSAWYPEPAQLPANLTRQALATLFYVANWFQIRSGGGYWDQYATESPLQHMWSLSIEEQFYVLFPLVMVALFALAFTRRRLVWVLGLGTLASWSLGVWRLADGQPFDRVYLGTETRIGAILCGATVGLLTLRPGARERLGRGAHRLSVPAFAVVVAALVLVDGETSWSAARWLIMPAFELCVAVLLVAAAGIGAQEAPTNRVASRRPLLWLGAISYGLYLWHIPLLLAAERAMRDEPRWLVLSVAIGLSLLVAQVSLTVIETPIRRKGLAAAPRFVLVGVGLAVVTLSVVSIHRSTAVARDVAPPTSDTGTADIVAAPDEPNTTIAPGERALPLDLPDGRLPRMLLVGDSMALDLGRAFKAEGPTLGYTPSTVSMIDCGVGGTDVSDEPGAFNDAEFGAKCDRWIAGLPEVVDTTKPDVVVAMWASVRATLPGSDVVLDRCSPEHREWFREALTEQVDVLSATGATVALATQAYNRFGEVSDAGRDREVDCINEGIEAVAAAHPNAVVLPAGSWVCPSVEECVTEVDGVRLRADGLHFRDDGAVIATNWIWDQLYDA